MGYEGYEGHAGFFSSSAVGNYYEFIAHRMFE